jgi:aspartyl protease
MAALQKASIALPPPQTGRFLVDTGASSTVIDPALIAPLSLTPRDLVPVHTPTTGTNPELRPVYDVQLILLPSVTIRSAQLGPLGNMPHTRALSVIATEMRHQGIDGLIGRDVLENVVLIYNGHTQSFTLSW